MILHCYYFFLIFFFFFVVGLVTVDFLYGCLSCLLFFFFWSSLFCFEALRTEQVSFFFFLRLRMEEAAVFFLFLCVC